MGRAIEMERDIDAMKMQLEKLENIVRGMTSTLDSLNQKSTKTKHVDLTEVKNGEEKTDNETDGGSSKPSNRTKSKSKSKAK